MSTPEQRYTELIGQRWHSFSKKLWIRSDSEWFDVFFIDSIVAVSMKQQQYLIIPKTALYYNIYNRGEMSATEILNRIVNGFPKVEDTT